MADITELLWQQFEVETQEHLDALEGMLGGLDAASADDETIASLFRAFHSLKGLAAAMGMAGMEVLAHAAESAMAPVREGKTALGAPLVDILVRALDALRSMQERAVADRADSTPPDDLVPALKNTLAGSTAAEPGPDAAEPSSEKTTGGSADDELAKFADRVLVTMTALVDAMVSASSDAMRALDDDLVKLDSAAGELGLHGFRRRVRGLSRAVHRDGPGVALLRDTAVSLATLEELTGRDAGRLVLLDMVAQRGAGDIGKLCARAAALFSGEARDDDPDAAALAMEAIADHTDLLELAHSGRVARLCADVLRRGAISNELKELMMDAAEAIAAPIALDPPGDLPESKADELIKALRGASDGLVDPVLGDRLQALGVDMALLALLPGDASERLRAAADDPNIQLVELDAQLESDPQFADQLAAWIPEHGDLIGSRIVDVDGQPATRLLIAMRTPEDDLAAALSSIDPTQSLTAYHVCDGRERRAQTRKTEARQGDHVVRVTSQALDSFMNRIGDLVHIQAGYEHATGSADLMPTLMNVLRQADEAGVDCGDLLSRFEQWNGRLTTLTEDLERTLKLLQGDALDLRVVPVDALLQRFPRVARDLARRHDKDIRVLVESRDARIDKGMVDVLSDPLNHMIRNAVDHGIEQPEERRALGKPDQATIALSAEQRGDRVIIEISDDGRGIDLDQIRARAVELGLASQEAVADMADDDVSRLLFAPGFSTAKAVTETSGRGVGMDVVDRAIVRLGGAIRVRTNLGKGTRFIMDLPLSAAIQTTVIVQQGDQVFAIPERFVHQVTSPNAAEERVSAGQESPLPIVGLGDLLNVPSTTDVNGERRVVVLALGQRRLGVGVDRVINRRDIYVKESHPGIASIPGIGGVSTLGDGRIVLILDPDGLMRLAFSGSTATQR